jgi:hypothetical protein
MYKNQSITFVVNNSKLHSHKNAARFEQFTIYCLKCAHVNIKCIHTSLLDIYLLHIQTYRWERQHITKIHYNKLSANLLFLKIQHIQYFK